MKKIYSLVFGTFMCANFLYAQTSTEQFETETQGSTSFTDNGVIFNIISNNAPESLFDIGVFPGSGWNGTAADNRFIDNTGTALPANTNVSFSIKTSSNLFKVNRFWIFLSNNTLNQNVSGTLTISGRSAGITKFTQTKTTGFVTSLGSTNGYTLVDLTNLNGQNYSNIVIDELRLTLGGAYTYAGLDAFTWVKDTNLVLGVSDVKNGKESFQIYPNPAKDYISFKNVESVEKVEIYDISGKLSLSTNDADKINVSKLYKGTYNVKVKTKNGIENSKFIKN